MMPGVTTLVTIIVGLGVSYLWLVFSAPSLIDLKCSNLPGTISDKGSTLCDFVCSVHDPTGGCTGHFQKS